MKVRNVLMFVVVVFISACSTSQKMTQNTITGDNYMAMGQYNEALNYFENNIRDLESKGKTINGEVFRKAGKSAFKLENTSKAQNYFEKAQSLNAGNAEMLLMLSDCYKEINNLSKEISALENYASKYPSGNDIYKVNSRLFETCLESENWELAEKLWNDFGSKTENDIKLLNVYLKVNLALNNDDKTDELATKLLKLDANNITALEKIGEKYFWKAENRYQKETEAYEKKKTRNQYAKLLKALEVVTADFKISMKYYKRLYKIQPDKNYARFLGNIYARLDDKENSTYYKNRAR